MWKAGGVRRARGTLPRRPDLPNAGHSRIRQVRQRRDTVGDASYLRLSYEFLRS